MSLRYDIKSRIYTGVVGLLRVTSVASSSESSASESGLAYGVRPSSSESFSSSSSVSISSIDTIFDPMGLETGFRAGLTNRVFIFLGVVVTAPDLSESMLPTVSATLTRLLYHFASAVLISSTLKSIFLSPLSTRLERASPTAIPRKRDRLEDAASLFETAPI